MLQFPVKVINSFVRYDRNNFLLLIDVAENICLFVATGATEKSHILICLYVRNPLQCMGTLVQFGGFLSTHLSPDEYSSKMPTLDKLGLEFNVPSDIAFFMLRPVIHNAISVGGHYLENPRPRLSLSLSSSSSLSHTLSLSPALPSFSPALTHSLTLTLFTNPAVCLYRVGKSQ